MPNNINGERIEPLKPLRFSYLNLKHSVQNRTRFETADFTYGVVNLIQRRHRYTSFVCLATAELHLFQTRRPFAKSFRESFSEEGDGVSVDTARTMS